MKKFPALCPGCEEPIIPVAHPDFDDFFFFDPTPQAVYVEKENKVIEACVAHVCQEKRKKKSKGRLHSHPGSGKTTSAKRPGEEAERSTSFLEPAPPRPHLFAAPPPGSKRS